MISRYLSEWERMGWVQASRGSIEVKNRSALSSYGGGETAGWAGEDADARDLGYRPRSAQERPNNSHNPKLPRKQGNDSTLK